MPTIKKHFPKSIAVYQHQNGDILDKAKPGITVYLGSNKGCDIPHYAEIISDDGSLYAEIGLEWEGNVLVGYDGVFDLPEEVKLTLIENGYKLDRYI